MKHMTETPNPPDAFKVPHGLLAIAAAVSQHGVQLRVQRWRDAGQHLLELGRDSFGCVVACHEIP
jgi:hypothetical protein